MVTGAVGASFTTCARGAYMTECLPINVQKDLGVVRSDDSSGGGIVLAIIGYRKFTDWSLFKETLKDYVIRYGMPTSIVSGGALGADSMAEKWAKRHKLPISILTPDWKRHGKAAGPLRNTDIINACTHVVAFPHEKGKGTQDSIRKAIASGKKIMIKNIK